MSKLVVPGVRETTEGSLLNLVSLRLIPLETGTHLYNSVTVLLIMMTGNY